MTEALLFYQLGGLHEQIRQCRDVAQKIQCDDLALVPIVKHLAECEKEVKALASARAAFVKGKSLPADPTHKGEWWNDRDKKQEGKR